MNVAVGPFTVAIDRSVDRGQEVLDQVQLALRLMERTCPERYRDAAELVPVLAVVDRRVNLRYMESHNAVMLPYAQIGAMAPEDIAAALVHETCHARLERFGIKFNPFLKQRIEATCLRAEVQFLEKVPTADELLRDARRRYELLSGEDPVV